MRKKHSFGSEAALCQAFLRDLLRGWTPYPEIGGFDILLSRDADGFQIGIQAKLRINAKVFAQAVEGSSYAVDRPCPDCIAVLVPASEIAREFGLIAAYTGVTIIRMSGVANPGLPNIASRWVNDDWRELCPARRIVLPDYVPLDVIPGRPSPISLSPWKVSALRLEALIEEKGHLTRADFKAARMDHRRWISPEQGWLERRDGVFVKGAAFPNFAAQHPIVFEQIKADLAKTPLGEQARLI